MLISELCSFYGISRQWLNRRVDRGEIPGVRRKANGRLEIFDETAATKNLNLGPKAKRDQEFNVRQRRREAAASIAFEKYGLKLPSGIRKITRSRLAALAREENARARQVKGDIWFAKHSVAHDPWSFRFTMQREWMKRGRGSGSKLARGMTIRWRENPGPHIVDDLQAMANYKALGKTWGTTKGKQWTLPKGNRHGSIAMIARTFGISRQALSQALRRLLQAERK